MKRNPSKILVVDDNAAVRKALQLLLTPRFAEVELLPSPATLPATMDRLRPDVVLLDMNFKTDINSGNEGLFWTDEILRRWPGTQVVLFTAYADINLAVEGMKRGAFDFVVKPWDNDKLVAILEAAAAKRNAENGKRKAESGKLRTANASASFPFSVFRSPFFYWGDSLQMSQMRRVVEKVAPTDATVLITGENGTGKDVLAHEIHALSSRRDKPLVCVDAGAIVESLFESELFGHVKGAFTDAHSDHKGKFEMADGGTLFLDEIGNLPLHLQAKLLRALQERKVVPVGSEKAVSVDIRLICATNRDLEAMVREGTFRQDLYFRINVFHLHIPALRERKEDLLPLAEMFVASFAERYHRQVKGLSSAAVEKLRQHRWSGNVRELQNVIERAVILCDGDQLEPSDLEINTTNTTVATTPLDDAEEQTIRAALQRLGGNLSLVAKELGISRPTLYAKLKRYNI
ncbi:MAG: sigma-54-dependent Fis family transcriptional regulator [Bacteroidales bacterium]|nr:sigma-54-dependent Fis family transcriptional regulator [Bacteroidales bacterium]